MTTVLEFTAADMRNALAMVNLMKVVELKAVCRSMFLATSGKKSDLQDKIKTAFMDAKNENNVVKLKTYDIIVKKVNNGDFSPRYDAIQASFVNRRMARALGSMEQTCSPVRTYQQSANAHPKTYITNNSFAGRQDKSEAPWIWFVESPFYKLKKIVHNSPKMAYKAPQSRGTCSIDFVLNAQEQELLASGDQFQLYLFSAMFTKTDSGKKSFIQFPQPLEIHFNKNLIKENVKGIKNKPGTARPANLTKFVRQSPHNNSLEVIYAFSTENYLIYCYIVEVISPTKLADKIVGEHSHISKTATMESIKKDFKEQDESDDLVELITTVSVKCPLTYTKMKYPARAVTCDHLQCFDVLNYLQLQEQVPTWLCPICNCKIKSIEDISISDYMLDIVHNTDDEVEVVTLLHDGTWEAQDPEASSTQTKADNEPKKEEESFVAESLDLDNDEDYDDLPLNDAANNKQTPNQSNSQPINPVASFFQQHSRPPPPPKNTYEGIEIISLDSDSDEENENNINGSLTPRIDFANHRSPAIPLTLARSIVPPQIPAALRSSEQQSIPLGQTISQNTNNMNDTVSDNTLEKLHGLINAPYSEMNGTYRDRPPVNRNDIYHDKPVISNTSEEITAKSKPVSRESSVESTIDQWFEENLNSMDKDNNGSISQPNVDISPSGQNISTSNCIQIENINPDNNNATKLNIKPAYLMTPLSLPKISEILHTGSSSLPKLPANSTSFLHSNTNSNNGNNGDKPLIDSFTKPSGTSISTDTLKQNVGLISSDPNIHTSSPLEKLDQGITDKAINNLPRISSILNHQQTDSGWTARPFISREFPNNSSNSTSQYSSLNINQSSISSQPLQKEIIYPESQGNPNNNFKSQTANITSDNNDSTAIPLVPRFDVGNSFMLRRDNFVDEGTPDKG